jgi:type I restriction enzyme S subunit
MQYQTQSTGITNFKFTVFLEKELVLKPTVEVQNQFADTIRPMLQLADVLGIKNSALRAARDLLLPKLLSGELGVSVPDIAAA